MPGNDEKNVTINNMPARVRNGLAKKAKEEFMSLSKYLLRLATKEYERVTKND